MRVFVLRDLYREVAADERVKFVLFSLTCENIFQLQPLVSLLLDVVLVFAFIIENINRFVAVLISGNVPSPDKFSFKKLLI